MLRGVLILGLIAAADVTAFHAESEMHPSVACLETFFASVRSAWFYVLDLIEVCAGFCHNYD